MCARKNNECGTPSGAYQEAMDVLMERVMPSEQQSAEWSVNGTKGPFGLLQTHLPGDTYERKRMLTIVRNLYNCRKRLIGRNQIRTVYADMGACVQPRVKDVILSIVATENDPQFTFLS